MTSKDSLYFAALEYMKASLGLSNCDALFLEADGSISAGYQVHASEYAYSSGSRMICEIGPDAIGLEELTEADLNNDSIVAMVAGWVQWSIDEMED